MSLFKVYQDYSADATLVSNVFIDHYLKDANDAQIKIYLYLLRVLCSHQSCSISDLADQFNYTEKDVSRALKYWERNGLLGLEYDDGKNLCGVRLLDIIEKTTQSSPLPLAPVVPIPVKSENSAPKEAPKARDNAYTPVKDSEKNDNNTEYCKKDYSPDQILEFRSRSEISELIFVVEQYLGKPLSLSQIKSVLFFHEDLGLSSELIDYLFDYCINKGKKDFHYIEKVAISWKEEGITTPKMAAKAAKKYDKIVYQVMNALGKTSSPTQKEADFVNKWNQVFAFDFEVIQEACERTVMSTDTHRFEYADKILTSWNSQGVHHKADVAALDDAFEKKKKANNQSSSGNASTPSYKQFSKRDYGDASLLEKEILSN